MGFLKGAFDVLSMTMTGKVLDRIDTRISAGQGQISLRLKRKDDASEAYVVVAITNAGKETLNTLIAAEFNAFADAAQTIKGELSKANDKVFPAPWNENIGFFGRAFYGIGMILTGKVLDRI